MARKLPPQCGAHVADPVAAKVSVLAQTGWSFDLSTASGKLMRTIMASLAEFERDLIWQRVNSGLAAARARGVLLGRQVGQRPSDKKSKRVLAMHRDGLYYRLIGRNVGLSKNTVMNIIRREAVARGRRPHGLQSQGRADCGDHDRSQGNNNKRLRQPLSWPPFWSFRAKQTFSLDITDPRRARR